MDLLQKSLSQLNEVKNMTEESKLEEKTTPEVVPNAELLPPSTVVKTEQKVESIKNADAEFEALAKSKGYAKIESKETKASIMWKSALIGLLTVLFGFWGKFLLQCYNPLTDSMFWSMGSFVDALYNTIISISGIGFFGKMKKYYDIQLETIE